MFIGTPISYHVQGVTENGITRFKGKRKKERGFSKFRYISTFHVINNYSSALAIANVLLLSCLG